MANNFVNSSNIGVNLQGNSDGATANFGLGQRVTGNAGSEWIYVTAAGAVTTGQLVSINASFSAQPATATTAYAGQALAFAQGAFASADYGWVCIRGQNMAVALSSVSTLNAALYIGTNSGTLVTVAGSGTLAGILLLSASATGVLNPATTAYLQYPRLNVGGALGV